jgi:hypothetical protein
VAEAAGEAAGFRDIRFREAARSAAEEVSLDADSRVPAVFKAAAVTMAVVAITAVATMAAGADIGAQAFISDTVIRIITLTVILRGAATTMPMAIGMLQPAHPPTTTDTEICPASRTSRAVHVEYKGYEAVCVAPRIAPPGGGGSFRR